MELKANETDKLINAMALKPTDDGIKYDWNTEVGVFIVIDSLLLFSFNYYYSLLLLLYVCFSMIIIYHCKLLKGKAVAGGW